MRDPNQQCKDNGPIEARTKDRAPGLVITARGKIVRGDELIDCDALAPRVLVEEYGFTADEIADPQSLSEPRRRKYEAAIAVQVQAQREAALNVRENQFVTKVDAARNVLSTAAFDVSGELYDDGSELIIVAISFAGDRRPRRRTASDTAGTIHDHASSCSELCRRSGGTALRRVEFSLRAETKTIGEIRQWTRKLKETHLWAQLASPWRRRGAIVALLRQLQALGANRVVFSCGEGCGAGAVDAPRVLADSQERWLPGDLACAPSNAAVPLSLEHIHADVCACGDVELDVPARMLARDHDGADAT
ncbi:MAG: hypothetical protein KY475_06800 [Planctomycetes bacterium]|nr:hypothetical protein [Planctomycetota bacterium]